MSNESSTNSISRVPELTDLVMLDVPVDVRLSPDGGRAAVTLRRTDWLENKYEEICHVYTLPAGTGQPMHRNGTTKQMEWVDADTLALLRTGAGGEDRAQIWLYEGLVGDGWQVTDHEGGVEWFKPFAGGLLFTAQDPKRRKNEARSDRFGRFVHFEQETSASALYYVDVEALRAYESRRRAATESGTKKLVRPVVELSQLLPEPLHIQGVVPCPTGQAVYLNCRQRDDLVYFRDSSVFRLSVNAKTAVAEHVAHEEAKRAGAGQDEPPDAEDDSDRDHAYLGHCERLQAPRFAFVADVSPDGQRLLVSHQGRDDKMYTRRDLWLLDLDQALAAVTPEAFLAAMRNLTGPVDVDILHQQYTAAGIVVTWVDGTVVRVTQFDELGAPTPLDFDDVYLTMSCHVSESGAVGFVGAGATRFAEAYVAESTPGATGWTLRQLTTCGQALSDWALGTVEVIRWQSHDGMEIEGVLRKPPGFDPSRQYPLVFVVHGGPSWFSAAYLLTREDILYYPSIQFANKDVLVLKPNYRGSIGRGQAFRELNVDNLGVGDLWDLESAIDHLAALGWIDEERIGCMGWSQGGYISAYAGLHSDRFRAVSVGAGISDWYTYHISNDIPDFTVDYLSASPFEDRAPYARSAPMSNLARAQTPMLIQHGTEDRRVPVSNATELYRGLKQKGVPVELYFFPGMAHPITKPRENRAVMHQNLAWFSHYLLDEPLVLE